MHRMRRGTAGSCRTNNGTRTPTPSGVGPHAMWCGRVEEYPSSGRVREMLTCPIRRRHRTMNDNYVFVRHSDLNP